MSQSETKSEYVRNVNEKMHCRNVREKVLSNDKPHYNKLMFIVFKGAIFNAFQECFKCGSKCSVFTKNHIGSLCSICVSCSMDSKHKLSWSTGNTQSSTVPVFHLLIASSVLSCGMGASKFLRLFHSLNIACIKRAFQYPYWIRNPFFSYHIFEKRTRKPSWQLKRTNYWYCWISVTDPWILIFIFL